jgi:hypothetical protein
MIARKTKFLILFTSQINIEWYKAPHVDMDLLCKKKKFNLFLEVYFWVYLYLLEQLEKNA